MPAVTKTRAVTVLRPMAERLLLHRMVGTDALSDPFEYRVEVLSEDPDIAFKDLLGQDMTIAVELPSGGDRFFNGVITEVSLADDLGHYSRYVIVLRPWLWLLNHWADCRIFQKMAVPDIVRNVMKDRGFTNVELKLSSTYPELEYCVQYRETDFSFVSRLLETAGIYYYFTHQENKHTLVLADDPGAHKEVEGYEEIPYYPGDPGAMRSGDFFYSWGEKRQVKTAKYLLGDYHFQEPNATFLGRAAKPLEGRDKGEIYDYPGTAFFETGGAKSDAGTQAATVRLQEAQARYRVAEGVGGARGLAAGALFKLTGNLRMDQNDKYVVVSASYTIIDEHHARSGSGSDEEVFTCRTEAIPATTHFRPPRRTPKPTISGPQTAIVVGTDGKEIDTDQHGRVKVKFHWDRNGQGSCWLRVAQAWAGANWGAIFLPRVGQEVIVEFLEGDPDQPIITGSVYNGVQKTPYPLPANATRSTIKSNSSKGGGGFNELRFEDKKGSEEIFVHAQKDFNREVREKDTLKVGTSGSGTQTIDIKNDRTVTIESGDDKLTLRQGNHTINISAGKSTVTAAQAIELKVGSSSIKIEPASITLSAPTIKISGSGMAEVSGGGMLTLKGGLVKIN